LNELLSLFPGPPVLGQPNPLMWGKVKEKTIWSYWYHPDTCPSSKTCTLPPHIQLCTETVLKNLGSFDYKIIHRDEVPHYVDMDMELPRIWNELKPQMQKDSLNNALLARYGGVTIDINSILFRPLDDYWDEMVQKGASFRGYMYRLNGEPWPVAMSTEVWFLMARRESVFRPTTTFQTISFERQSVNFGPRLNPKFIMAYVPYHTFGDYALTPILSMYNYSLPKCHEDKTVSDTSLCPEFKGPDWSSGLTGPQKTDMTLLLRDPRDGPAFPFIMSGGARGSVGMWNVSNGTRDPNMAVCKSKTLPCCSQKECWENIFLRRFNKTAPEGEARALSFVKFFDQGDVGMKSLTRSQLLAQRDSYFVRWLQLSGLPV